MFKSARRSGFLFEPCRLNWPVSRCLSGLTSFTSVVVVVVGSVSCFGFLFHIRSCPTAFFCTSVLRVSTPSPPLRRWRFVLPANFTYRARFHNLGVCLWTVNREDNHYHHLSSQQRRSQRKTMASNLSRPRILLVANAVLVRRRRTARGWFLGRIPHSPRLLGSDKQTVMRYAGDAPENCVNFSTLGVRLVPTGKRLHNKTEEITNHCDKGVRVCCEEMLMYALSKCSESMHLASCVQYRIILPYF